MLRLIQKNSVFYILYAGVLLPLMALYLINTRDALDGMGALFLGQWLMLLVVGSLMVVEQNEKKFNGYSFLRTLPLTSRQIVGSKFLLVFLMVFFLFISENIILVFIQGTPELLKTARIFIFLFANGALILSALIYVISFKFGQSRASLFAWIVLPSIFILPIPIVELSIRKGTPDPEKMVDWLISVPLSVWAGVTLLTLFVFFVLFRLAAKAEENRWE